MPDTSTPPRRFPEGFTWGVATSSFQIEGAAAEDGRSESIWDRLCATPGAIEDGTDGKVACDHYHRWREDVALIASLGMGAYRFSIAWPRVLPEGTGRINAAGLDFYERLVDGLLERGVRPFATLYHWDLPQVLQDRGGWATRDTVHAFEEYTYAVTHRLGDRVHDWMTHNEPWCVAVLGNVQGHHAPALKDWSVALKVAHHLLLSHGRAVPIIRENSPGARVGIVLNLSPAYPASGSPADVAAARASDGELNRWYLDPLYGRGYPRDMMEGYVAAGHADGWRFVRDGDLSTIAVPTDFLGINYYMRAIVRSDAVPEASNAPRELFAPPASELTDMGWEVYPDGLRALLMRVHREYAPKAIVVAENGAAYSHGPDADGRVRDEPRRRYLEGHLNACLDALDEGVPLRGYFAWSLMDNFEWAWGYRKRFGLVHVDYATQVRTVKDSGRWFSKVARTNTLQGVEP
jgi:beta-glucosidase